MLCYSKDGFSKRPMITLGSANIPGIIISIYELVKRVIRAIRATLVRVLPDDPQNVNCSPLNEKYLSLNFFLGNFEFKALAVTA